MPDRTSEAEIYVGYLPLPYKQRLILLWLVPALVLLVCVAALVWAGSQREPGTGVWNDGKPIRVRGVLTARPYPILFCDSPDGRPTAVLLVEVGKVGAAHNAAALDGRVVWASGWPLQRDGRRMLELEPEPEALTADEQMTTLPPVETALGQAVLRGTIVDSKCYLGAMKPGEGKAHKQCATLCIRGGIPPMLVVDDSAGRSYVLLAGPEGGPLDPAAYPFIGDDVELRGELSERGGLRVLRVQAADIRRL